MTGFGVGQSFGEVAAQARHTIDRLGQLRDQAEQVSVTETSADGSITVTVNSAGVLIDLIINSRAAAWSGARIAAEVMDVTRKAQSRIAERMSELMRDDDIELRDRVLAVYHDRFPDPQPTEKAKPFWSRNEDEEGSGSIMRGGDY
jgi:hypothetical protein